MDKKEFSPFILEASQMQHQNFFCASSSNELCVILNQSKQQA